MPNYAVYECADGRFLAVGALEPKFFHEVLRAVNRPELARLPMAAGPKGEPLRRALAELFRSRTRDEWERELAHLDSCVSGVLTPAEALRNEQVQARGIVEMQDGKPVFGFPVKFSHARTCGGVSPKLGADNAALLPAR